MYRIFLERAAEKDLKRLPNKLHNRVIYAIQALAKIHVQQVAENSRVATKIGVLR